MGLAMKNRIFRCLQLLIYSIKMIYGEIMRILGDLFREIDEMRIKRGFFYNNIGYKCKLSVLFTIKLNLRKFY